MQLTITVLGYTKSRFIDRILNAVNDCHCSVIELRANRLLACNAAYLSISGEWNQIAKLESILDSLEKKLEIKIHCLRPGSSNGNEHYTPYSLETISLEHQHALQSITVFILGQNITIDEISCSRYQDCYGQSELVSTRYILLIPQSIRILSLRDELMEFCDQINVDAMFEPIKR